MTSCLLSCTPAPSEMGSTLKGKSLLPRGANSFSFSEGNQNSFEGVASIEHPLR